MVTLTSGDYRVDALLKQKWWASVAFERLPDGIGLAITYGFPNVRPADWLNGLIEFSGGKYTELNDQLKASVRSAFSTFEKQCGIKFIEVADGMDAQIRLGMTDVYIESKATGIAPGNGTGGDIWIYTDLYSRIRPEYTNYIISHEIGHAPTSPQLAAVVTHEI